MQSSPDFSPIALTPEASTRSCIHCGNAVPKGFSIPFCCNGCEAVYQWIHESRLGKYYEIRQKVRSLRNPNAAQESSETFAYLDDLEFLKLYSWETRGGRSMDFYLEGVHCAACVWLTEKVADLVDHVKLVRLNLGSSVATVQVDEQGLFSEAAKALQKMGYRPHPVKRGESGSLQQRENRIFLIRVGVAAACAGNIMLLAISLYAGASGLLAERFRWLSLALYLPVLTFSAWPFYRSAWNSLRSYQVSIDIPVVFGLLLGSIVSVFNLISGDERIYFDSLSALIFLLLSTRYLLKRTQQSALESSRLMRFLAPSFVRRWNDEQDSYETVSLERVSVGDIVQVRASEPIPVDGVVIEGRSTIDASLLTGEADPEIVNAGTEVFAGTVNRDSPIEVQVTRAGGRTRVGQILSSMESLLARKANVALFADRVSRYFVAAVVILSVIVFACWGIGANWAEGLNRALAISIVTCPCTFALITPLALSMTLGKLARSGVLVKGPDVLEKIASARSLFLDKTGTLTVGKPEVTVWDVPPELSASILAIESHSNHPVAKAIAKHLRSQGIDCRQVSVSDLVEKNGTGIRARVGSDLIDISRAVMPSSTGTEVTVRKNGHFSGRIVLVDPLRLESKRVVEELRAFGLKPWILSGDHRAPVLRAAAEACIGEENCVYEASPEIKALIVQDQPRAIMVGDGANDAIALAQADVGIAVHGGMEVSLRAADVYLRKPGIQAVCELVVISRESLKVIRRNLAFSLIYNVVACGFALAGKIDPLFAAVLMPLSAATVFLSSVIGTAQLRGAFRRLNA